MCASFFFVSSILILILTGASTPDFGGNYMFLFEPQPISNWIMLVFVFVVLILSVFLSANIIIICL